MIGKVRKTVFCRPYIPFMHDRFLSYIYIAHIMHHLVCINGSTISKLHMRWSLSSAYRLMSFSINWTIFLSLKKQSLWHIDLISVEFRTTIGQIGSPYPSCPIVIRKPFLRAKSSVVPLRFTSDLKVLANSQVLVIVVVVVEAVI